MSSIDISITEKETGKWIINKKFCRSSALDFFCANASDDKLQSFDYEIIMGVELNQENVSQFISKIQHVINYLLNIPSKHKKEHYTKGEQLIYSEFLEDLQNSKNYIEQFVEENDIEKYKIEILQ